MSKVRIPGEFVASPLMGRARLVAAAFADCYRLGTARHGRASALITGFASWIMAPTLRASTLPHGDVEELLSSIDGILSDDFPDNTFAFVKLHREKLEADYRGIPPKDAARLFFDMISGTGAISDPDDAPMIRLIHYILDTPAQAARFIQEVDRDFSLVWGDENLIDSLEPYFERIKRMWESAA